MARSRSKQGNARTRVRVKDPSDPEGKRNLRDAHGRVVTIPRITTPFGSLRGTRRRAHNEAMWAKVRQEREAEETRMAAIRARINARFD